MELLFIWVLGLFLVFTWRKGVEHRQRVQFLAQYLQNYQIEKLMETLMQGYLRALSEPDTQRQQTIWNNLQLSEVQLKNQFQNLVTELSKAPETLTRVSKIPFDVPWLRQGWPASTFDLRALMRLHAQGISSALSESPSEASKDRAFQLTAELMLMQHSCHWFCKSKIIASARLMTRHKTTYEQTLSGVGPATRKAYVNLTTAA